MTLWKKIPAWARNCTCTWSNHSEGGSLYVRDTHCPAWPHPSYWTIRSDEKKS